MKQQWSERRTERDAPTLAMCSAIVIFTLITATTVSHADTTALGSQLEHCRAITDNNQRLKCYDALPSAAAATQAPVAPSTQAVTAAPSERNFGAEAIPAPDLPKPKAIQATVVGHLSGIAKNQVLRLDNGQEWRVVDDRSYDYDGTAPKVILDRNVIGTYWLEIPDGGIRIKVRRIK